MHRYASSTEGVPCTRAQLHHRIFITVKELREKFNHFLKSIKIYLHAHVDLPNLIAEFMLQLFFFSLVIIFPCNQQKAASRLNANELILKK